MGRFRVLWNPERNLVRGRAKDVQKRLEDKNVQIRCMEILRES
jgi:hypothetical protein